MVLWQLSCRGSERRKERSDIPEQTSSEKYCRKKYSAFNVVFLNRELRTTSNGSFLHLVRMTGKLQQILTLNED